MASTELNVKYVAHLARLKLSTAEEEKLGSQLGNILVYIEKLKAVDVSQVEPTAHAVPLLNVTRPDEVRPSFLMKKLCATLRPKPMDCSSCRRSWSSSSTVESRSMIASIAFFVYSVRDIATARRFYEGTLGLELETNVRDEWIEYDVNGGTFAITTMDSTHVPGGNGGVIAFEVTNLDLFVRVLEENRSSSSSRSRLPLCVVSPSSPIPTATKSSSTNGMGSLHD